MGGVSRGERKLSGKTREVIRQNKGSHQAKQQMLSGAETSELDSFTYFTPLMLCFNGADAAYVSTSGVRSPQGLRGQGWRRTSNRGARRDSFDG